MRWAGSESIQQVFEERVENTPLAPSCLSDDRGATFLQTNEDANRLAHCLRSAGIGPGDFVGVCMDNSPELPATLLGVVKSGAAFVGLDPSHPGRRHLEILADTGCRALIADPATGDWNPYPGLKLVAKDARLADFHTHNPECRAGPDDPFQVVYTSGSTGRSKGVLLSQRSFVKKLEWMQQWSPFERDDVLLMHRSISLSVGTWDCFMGPLTGLPTVVMRRQRLYHPGAFYSILRAHGISYLFASPPLIQEVLKQAELDPSPDLKLKLATSSGERLPDSTIRRWMDVFPNVPILDVYGASEYSSAMVFDVGADVRDGAGRRRGREATNTRVFILNEDLSPAAPGEPGEICISGAHMALGYLNDPVLTARKFVRNPFNKGSRLYRTGDTGRRHEDGSIELIGRNGEIVKINGMRVGLAEIEDALAAHEAIRKSIVVPVGDPPRLLAFFVADVDLTKLELRKHLMERLPLHMIPSFFVRRQRLPKTLAGKLDRQKLKGDAAVIARNTGRRASNSRDLGGSRRSS
ncbi:MAG: amino acid adenylation domain-containing protein [Arenicellales bacterium]